MARKQKNIHYIYKITNLINNKYYIGIHSTCNLEDGYMGSGRYLKRSVRKYGVENFKKEILEFFTTRELLIEAEKVTITSDMIIDKLCMNLKGGGEGGFISEEQQRHRSACGGKAITNKRKINIELDMMYRKLASKIMKENNDKGLMLKSTGFKNKKHSEETITNFLQTRKGKGLGKTNSQYGTCWITREGVNKKRKH